MAAVKVVQNGTWAVLRPSPKRRRRRSTFPRTSRTIATTTLWMDRQAMNRGALAPRCEAPKPSSDGHLPTAAW